MPSSDMLPSTISSSPTPIVSTCSCAEGSACECLHPPVTAGCEILASSNLKVILASPNLKAFKFDELKNATRNFHPSRLIGQGSFGRVYRGRIDEQTLSPGSGTPVAVKKHEPKSFQGNKEWLTEIRYLSQLSHPNIVKLIGFCSEGNNLLLVYEFMQKGSLKDHLFGRGLPTLSWATRIKVATGVARGLSLLHDANNQIIHRDVHTSHILLDPEFNAKLSGFNLALDGPEDGKTHVSTLVMGTYGTIDPEYAVTGHVSAKCDVYSFGVLLMELLSGRRAIDAAKSETEHNLMDWARTCLGDKKMLARIMDPKLDGNYPEEGATAVAVLALQCADGKSELRPQMYEVLGALEKL